MEVSVLGTDYTIQTGVKSENDSYFSSNEQIEGYIDYQTKEIFIKEMPKDEPGLTRNLASYEKSVIRHELIHAFFYESGLTDYAGDERIVEWLEVQVPKMAKLFNAIEV